MNINVYFYLFISNILCVYSISENYLTPILSRVLELLEVLGTALPPVTRIGLRGNQTKVC